MSTLPEFDPSPRFALAGLLVIVGAVAVISAVVGFLIGITLA